MIRRYDLVIVGMGSAGMVAAEFASTLQIKVAAVERGLLGGDCLWTGLRAVEGAARLGEGRPPHAHGGATSASRRSSREIDLAKVFERDPLACRTRIAATDDSPERFTDELGIELIAGSARLLGPTALDVDGERIEARFILLCTGSRPVEPPIPGLADAGFLTSRDDLGRRARRRARSSRSAAGRSRSRWRRASAASACR